MQSSLPYKPFQCGVWGVDSRNFLLSRGHFQVSGACDRPSWGASWTLPTHPKPPSLVLHLSPFNSGGRGALWASGSHWPFPAFQLREHSLLSAGGRQNLEDCPSARQPLPRRSMPVGRSSVLWFEGRWQSIWEAESVKRVCISLRDLSPGSGYTWAEVATVGPSPVLGLLLPHSSPGWVKQGRAQALRGGRGDAAQAPALPRRGWASSVSQAGCSERRNHSPAVEAGLGWLCTTPRSA